MPAACPPVADGTGHANAPLRTASGGRRSRWSLLLFERMPPRPRGLLPSRAGARRNGGAVALRFTAPPADHHRITGPLCDVDPFRRTPAWPPAQNVRLAHSPHILNLRPPFGLKQNVFCSLGSRPRDRGSSVKLNGVGCANAAPPLPPPVGRPMRKALRAEPGRCLQVFGTVRTPPSVFSFSCRGTPAPRFPWAVRITPTVRGQARGRPLPQSRHAGSAAPVTPAPTLRAGIPPPRRSRRHAACLCSASAVAPQLRGVRDASLPKPKREVGAWKAKLLQERATALNASVVVLTPGKTGRCEHGGGAQASACVPQRA